MLAAERISQRKGTDDGNPVHYENRLIADIGDLVGLTMDDIRRAHLDEHAARRYPTLQPTDRDAAAKRCRELFDVEALLHAFVSEVHLFDEDSALHSLPRLFVDWISSRMTQKHKLLDEATCSRVEISPEFALVVLELLYLGKHNAS